MASLLCSVVAFGSSLVNYSVSSLHFFVYFDKAVRFCLLLLCNRRRSSIMFCTCYFMLCLSTYVSLWLCCTVRNQAELFRDKTGVVLSGRLSRPPGFVEFTAVCAPVLPLVGTVFVCNFDVALYWVIQLGQPIM